MNEITKKQQTEDGVSQIIKTAGKYIHYGVSEFPSQIKELKPTTGVCW